MTGPALDEALFDRHPDGVVGLRRPDGAPPDGWIFSYANPAARDLLGMACRPGQPARPALEPHKGGAELLARLAGAAAAQPGWRISIRLAADGLSSGGGDELLATGLAHDDSRVLLFLARTGTPHADADADATWPGLAPRIIESRLRKSERRFQQFMDNCPASAYIKDSEGRYVWVNREVERFARLPGSQWIGRRDEDLFPPEEAARLRTNDLAVRSRNDAISFLETVTYGGQRQTCLSYKFPMLDDHGACTGVAGISVNITEQARSREAVDRLNTELETRAAELQTLLDTVPVAICRAHDPACHVITGNKAAARLLRIPERHDPATCRSATREPGVPYRMFDQGRELAPDDMPIRRAARGQEIRGHEYEIVFEDGACKSIFGQASPLYDAAGAVRGGVAAFLDITELKVSEAVVEQRSRRLQLLWEAAGILMRVQEPDAMVRELFAKIGPELEADVYYNYLLEPDGLALRLVSSGGIAPAALESLRRIPLGEGCGSAGRQDHAARVADVLASTLPLATEIRRTGVQACVSNPLVAGGCIIGVLAFGSRTRHHFADEDVEFIQTITQYVAVAYERIRLVEQLRDADRRKDDFLATLAHELRNPLAPIRNAVHVLKAKGPPDPQLVWGREVIERQVHHMARLLEDLLDVSRISRDKLELRRERVDIAGIIDTAVETSRPWIDAGQHQLTVHVAHGQPLVVDGDPVRLAQIFSNLLTNAAKYTPEGGSIALQVFREDDRVVVAVRDNGIGIAREMLGRVFDMFSQAQPALQRAQGGLGIGLSLVKGLVDLHGGTIRAESPGPGGGSTFSVSLPLAPAGAETEAGDPVAAALALRHRVLVVDDNVDNAESLGALLEIMGCEVVTAYDGEAALNATEAFHPTVVMLDIGMPGMNGFEVCRRLRAMPWSRGVLIVAMTGWGQAEDRARTREAGFDHHLVKPVDTAELANLLSQVTAS